MTKKSQKFWKIDEIFSGNGDIFRETPKKVVKKFRQKFGPPVSEVLDPLVNIRLYMSERPCNEIT